MPKLRTVVFYILVAVFLAGLAYTFESFIDTYRPRTNRYGESLGGYRIVDGYYTKFVPSLIGTAILGIWLLRNVPPKN